MNLRSAVVVVGDAGPEFVDFDFVPDFGAVVAVAVGFVSVVTVDFVTVFDYCFAD